MSSKHPSSTELVKEAQQKKIDAFASEYYALCEKHGLQIVQSPLSVQDYKKPEPIPNENKVAS